MTKSSPPNVSRPLRRALDDLVATLAHYEPVVLKATVTVRHSYNYALDTPSFSHYSGMIRISPRQRDGPTHCIIETPFDDGKTYRLDFSQNHFYADEQNTKKGNVTLTGIVYGAVHPNQSNILVEIVPLIVTSPISPKNKSRTYQSFFEKEFRDIRKQIAKWPAGQRAEYKRWCADRAAERAKK